MAGPRHLADLAGTRRNQFRIKPAGTTGAPSSGYHQIGEEHVDSAGARFYCTASGTPGTWSSTVTPASAITNTPAGNIVATDVQAAINELDTEKVAKAGDTMTGPLTTPSVKETVFTITDGAAFEIDPANGGIQIIVLGANRTPAATNFAAGQSVTLMVADGTAYAITWTTIGVVWVGGTAPTLTTSGYTVIELWKVGTTVYGALVGNVA